MKDHPKRILLAEDDTLIMQLLTLQLERAEYEVIQTRDGKQAWEALQQAQLPDLVILDILMPKMDGLQVCRQIRATPRMATLPIIILTALQDAASKLDGLEAGANDFLSKPWNKTELYTRIRTLLRLKEVQDALQDQHHRLELLYETSRELSASLNLEEMLQLVLSRAATSVQAPQGSLILLRGQHPEHIMRLNQDGEAETIHSAHLKPIEKAVASRILDTRRPLLMGDAARPQNHLEMGDARSLIAVPFYPDKQLVGLLLLLHPKPQAFEGGQLDLLGSMTRQAAISIENAWLFAQVHEERQRFAALIASMDDAVLATDRARKVILVNPAASQLLGCSSEQVEQRPIGTVIEDPNLMELFDRVGENLRPLSSEIPWSDGRTYYATVSPVGGEGQVAVVQDISAIKELQAIQLEAEQEKTARVRETFERYMSPELVNRALTDERGLMEKRERRSAVVLFADLRGFTRLTVQFSPDDVVAILNEFFTIMTDIAYAHKGTIFDIAGDELMVAFGVPFELPDPAAAAVEAGIEMQKVFDDLSREWGLRYDNWQIGMGVGIDYGELVVGNVGSPSRMNYALVGRPVNTAHALVSRANDGEILLSKAIMQGLQSRLLRQQAVKMATDVQLKGYDEPQTIYRMTIRGSDGGPPA